VNINEKKVQLLRIGNYKISVISSPDNTYYLNSGNDASSNPLIYCQTSSTCTTTTAKNGDYFINGDDHKSLLYCQSNKKGNGIICSVKKSSLKSTGSEFYLNAGEDKMNYQLIKCTYVEDNITCSKDDSPFQKMDTIYYLNGSEMKSTYPLIQCKFDYETSQHSICSEVSSGLTEESTKYYIHYDKSQINQQLIECSFTKGGGISCADSSSGLAEEGVEYYINGGEDKLTQPLIKCEWVQGDTTASCSTEVSNLKSKGQEYYLNYGKDRNVNPLIQCQYTEDDENVKDNEKAKCYTQSITGNKVIYKNAAISTGLTKSLIECTSPSPQCQLKDGEVNKIYKNHGAVSITNALINCDFISCEYEDGNENGCYLNGAGTQLIQAIITCNANRCVTVDANNGDFYVNSKATNLNQGIISCYDEGCTMGTSNAKIGFYLSAFDRTDEGKYPVLIECNSNKCERKLNPESGFYVSGEDKIETDTIHEEDFIYSQLIQCDEGYCSKLNDIPPPGYYLNGDDQDQTYPILRHITADQSIFEKVDSDTLAGSCGSTTVGNPIKDQTGNYYLCIDNDDDSRIPFSNKSSTKTTTFYNVILSKDGIFGASRSEILIKIGNRSAVLATTTLDTDTYHHLYVDHGTNHLSTKEKYEECSHGGSVIRYTLSEDQTIIESLPCKSICYPASDEPSDCDIGYYLVEKNDPLNIVTEPNKQGILYYCNSSTTCHEVPKSEVRIGYLRNINSINKNIPPYIICSLDPTSSSLYRNIICQTVAVTATNCSEVSIAGDLIVVEGENGIPSYKICLQGASSNDGILIDPTVHTSTLYVFNITNRSIFNLNQQNMFIILDIKDGQVLLYSFKNIILKYLFTNKNYKVLNKNEMLDLISANQGDTTICNDLYEFEMVKEEGESEALYKKND